MMLHNENDHVVMPTESDQEGTNVKEGGTGEREETYRIHAIHGCIRIGHEIRIMIAIVCSKTCSCLYKFVL
jgi:hypothetical protein